jgi:hypothetical protein
MFYHTNCGHILNVEEGSMMVADNGWKDYTNHYLSSCPVCEGKYPYMKYLDDSVREDVENLVYRIWSLGCTNVYVPTFQRRVDTIRLKRRGTLGTGFVWSQEAIGIKGHQMIIETSDSNVRVDNLSCKKVLGSSEKIKRSLMADSTTKFSSIEIELDDEGFEKKVEPIKEAPVQYSRFTDKLAFERPRRDSYGLIGRVLTKLRTPSDTTRYRESVFQSGDEISVIGKKTRNGLSFESPESMNPLISSKHISKIEQKYRRAYLFQLYLIPVFCVLFSAVMTYGSYA